MKQVSNKKLAVVSRATYLKYDGAYQPCIMIENDGAWDTWVYIKDGTMVQALDKAHYDNANSVQFGNELSGAWIRTHRQASLKELHSFGYKV